MRNPFLKKIFILLVLLLPLTARPSPDDGSPAEPEKNTAVEQIGIPSVGESEKSASHCESETDRLICNNVNDALVYYYQTANHIPVGDYERNYLMDKLINDMEAAKQSTLNEFGPTDSMEMYTALINFVKFKERTEMLFKRKETDKADYYRNLAFKNHDRIIEYCTPCVDVLK